MAADGGSIGAPQQAADARAVEINQAHAVRIGYRGRAVDDDRLLAPAVATLIDPQ